MLTRLIKALTFPCSSIRCLKTPVRPINVVLTFFMAPIASDAALSILLGMAILLGHDRAILSARCSRRTDLLLEPDAPAKSSLLFPLGPEFDGGTNVGPLSGRS